MALYSESFFNKSHGVADVGSALIRLLKSVGVTVICSKYVYLRYDLSIHRKGYRNKCICFAAKITYKNQTGWMYFALTFCPYFYPLQNIIMSNRYNYDLRKRYDVERTQFDDIYIKYSAYTFLYKDFYRILAKQKCTPSHCFNDMLQNSEKYYNLYESIVENLKIDFTPLNKIISSLVFEFQSFMKKPENDKHTCAQQISKMIRFIEKNENIVIDKKKQIVFDSRFRFCYSLNMGTCCYDGDGSEYENEEDEEEEDYDDEKIDEYDYVNLSKIPIQDITIEMIEDCIRKKGTHFLRLYDEFFPENVKTLIPPILIEKLREIKQLAY